MLKIPGLLHRQKLVYLISILKSMYNTLILPNNSYCILSWRSHIDKMHFSRKRAIRNISKSDFRAKYGTIM